jgi:hypothetical protein
MAQTAVEGKNVLIKFLKDGEYVPYACATSIDYYKDREAIETSTVDSAGWAEYVYGFGTWGMTLGGVTHIVPTNGIVADGFTVFEMLQKQLNKLTVDLELSFEDSAGNIKTLVGTVIIPHVGISAGAEGFSEDSVELQGTGVPEIGTTLIDPVVNTNEVIKIEYTATGGETTVQYDELIGKTKEEILHVHRDAGILEVIDVGTPTDRQVKIIAGTGTLSLLTALSAGEFFLILYK